MGKSQVSQNWHSIKNCLRRDLGLATKEIVEKIEDNDHLKEVVKVVKDNVPRDLKKDFKEFVQQATENPAKNEEKKSVLTSAKDKVTSTATSVTSAVSNTADSVKTKAQIAVGVSKFMVKSTAGKVATKATDTVSSVSSTVSGGAKKLWSKLPWGSKIQTSPKQEDPTPVEDSPLPVEPQPETVKEPAVSKPEDKSDCKYCDGNCTGECVEHGGCHYPGCCDDEWVDPDTDSDED